LGWLAAAGRHQGAVPQREHPEEPPRRVQNRVYEVLARSRPLTMPMVWRLHTQLGIPAESLIRPVKTAPAQTDL
jgi:hypothetical protein